ncbi:ATP-dependent DNA helicase sgs1 [Actinomortierella ambigua]|uniref:DNA 3'-5' helicase n=1 Tax=Actinomortierella ambigua TaxID=1343610 RepID=A0A9P6PZJ0_9FUNG|nr:ATP-dependent DNA helicase sgs1 [Actinomortierella ambigua]
MQASYIDSLPSPGLPFMDAILNQPLPESDSGGEEEEIDDYNGDLLMLGNKNIPCFLLSTHNESQISHRDMKAIAKGFYRAVFVSPDLIFGPGNTAKKVRRIWRKEQWQHRLSSLVVDEVDSADLQPYYKDIGQLRKEAPKAPILGLTSTLPPERTDKVKKAVFGPSSKVEVIRVKDICDDIQLEVQIVEEEELEYHFPWLLGRTRTVVYFNSSLLLRRVQSLLKFERPDLRVDCFFALRVPAAKQKVIQKFRNNEIDVLLTTDDLSVGSHFSDVATVIQYGLPQDLSSLMQRFGHAARNPQLRGHAILLAPPTTSGKYSRRTGILEFVKAMRGEEKVCRWEVIDEYFGNSFRRRNECCDVCLQGPYSTGNPITAAIATDREQRVGRRRLLEWRESAFQQASRDGELQQHPKDCYLPPEVIDLLSRKLHAATTAANIQVITKTTSWIPFKAQYPGQIARVVMEALAEANTIHGDQQEMDIQGGTSAVDQSEDAPV